MITFLSVVVVKFIVHVIVSDMKEGNVENINVIEQSANFEGNDTLLLYERLQDPFTKEKLVNLIHEYQSTTDRPSRIIINDGNDGNLEFPIEKWVREIQPLDVIENELNQNIEKVFNSTEISSEDEIGGECRGYGHVGEIFNFSKNINTGERWSPKQLSIIEAHEKGHGIRYFYGMGKSFVSKIQSGFDIENVVISKKLFEILRKFSKSKEYKTDKEVRDDYVEYMFDPKEIFERMSQLKNYFGFKGNEMFTKEHLAYAKNNYCKDTGMGEQIALFLEAITPETESKFLELINNLGI